MSRIVGVDIPDNKAIWIGLTQIRGVGRSLSTKILDQLDIDRSTKLKELTEGDLRRIKEVIEKDYKIEGDLNLENSQNIRRLKESGSYRGDRHKKNLPVRGQRTKTNARTKRGRRVTVGSGRRPAAEKT